VISVTMSSGLFDFFKDFLPSTATEDLQEEGEEEEEEEDLYGRILLSYNEENANVSDHGNIDSYCDGDMSSVGSKAGSKPWRTSFESFGDWRKGQKEQILLYLHDRIHYSPDFHTEETDNDTYASVFSVNKVDKSGSGDHNDPDDVEWESQKQGLPESTSKDGITATPATTGKHDRTRYPHIKRALNFVSRMEDIDMYTKEVSLDLCLVEKTWPLRSTRRCSNHPHPFKTKAKFPTYHGRLPRVPFLYKEDDGPFAPVYKTVLSIEVIQLVHQPRQNETFSNVPLVSCSTDTSPRPIKKKRRLRVFFYNQYAEAMDKWLTSVKFYTKVKRSREENPGPNRDLVISFRHIPAVCILPYVWNPRNFLDAEESMHYCLCIGDSAKLQIPVSQFPNGEYSILRLDEAPDSLGSSRSSPLEVQVATWDAPANNIGTKEELILSQESLNCKTQNGKSVHASMAWASGLALALENWKRAEKSHQQQECIGNRSAATIRSPSATTENMGLDQSEATGDERSKRARTDKSKQNEIRALTNSMEYVKLVSTRWAQRIVYSSRIIYSLTRTWSDVVETTPDSAISTNFVQRLSKSSMSTVLYCVGRVPL
jgi:hypothetical protein